MHMCLSLCVEFKTMFARATEYIVFHTRRRRPAAVLRPKHPALRPNRGKVKALSHLTASLAYGFHVFTRKRATMCAAWCGPRLLPSASDRSSRCLCAGWQMRKMASLERI